MTAPADSDGPPPTDDGTTADGDGVAVDGEGPSIDTRRADDPLDGDEPALDAWADRLRQRHLDDALARLDDRETLDDADRAAVAACSRAIVDELLQRPRSYLRHADPGARRRALAVFDLDDDR